MPAPVLNLGATVLCSHGGEATALSPDRRVLVTGQPAVTIASRYVVAGCGLPVEPCATGQWLTGAGRVLAGGTPVAVQSGASTCMPSMAPMVAVAVQSRVTAGG